MGSLWSIITIVGPILLAIGILWAISANRKRSAEQVEATEQATQDLYDRIDRDDRKPGQDAD